MFLVIQVVQYSYYKSFLYQNGLPINYFIERTTPEADYTEV